MNSGWLCLVRKRLDHADFDHGFLRSVASCSLCCCRQTWRRTRVRERFPARKAFRRRSSAMKLCLETSAAERRTFPCIGRSRFNSAPSRELTEPAFSNSTSPIGTKFWTRRSSQICCQAMSFMTVTSGKLDTKKGGIGIPKKSLARSSVRSTYAWYFLDRAVRIKEGQSQSASCVSTHFKISTNGKKPVA